MCCTCFDGEDSIKNTVGIAEGQEHMFSQFTIGKGIETSVEGFTSSTSIVCQVCMEKMQHVSHTPCRKGRKATAREPTG